MKQVLQQLFLSLATVFLNVDPSQVRSEFDWGGFLQLLEQHYNNRPVFVQTPFHRPPSSYQPAPTATLVPPLPRPTSGGLLCGMNKYSDVDTFKEASQYSGPARRNEAPWLVRVIDKNTYRWLCDGAIINKRAVLTTAECVKSKFRRYDLVLADHIFASMDPQETTVSVGKTIIHPDFDPSTKKNNFAILLTSTAIPMDKTTIRPICLPPAGERKDYSDSIVTTVGWGLGLKGKSRILHKDVGTNLIKSTDECATSYESRGHGNMHIGKNGSICIGNGVGDICKVESGSPLTEYRHGRHFLIGIGSLVGHGCGSYRAHLPAVYGRVAQVVPWILQHTSSSSPEAVDPPKTPAFVATTKMPRPVIPTRRPPTTVKPPSNTNLESLSKSLCGTTKYMADQSKASARIIGGDDAKINEVPWQTRIVVNGYLCGGTIIHKRAILTAAHCIISKYLSSYKVIIGDHTRSTYEFGEQSLELDAIIPHEDYDEDANVNDFALIITSEDIPFTTWSVQPACLPSKSSDKTYTGYNATISGWGRISAFSKRTPDELQLTTVSVLSNSKCSHSYRPRNWLDAGVDITDEMLCAAAPNKDTCQGDSGGPLTAIDNGRHVLIGVTSFGKKCGSSKYPGVYARVSTALDWIEENLNEYAN